MEVVIEIVCLTCSFFFTIELTLGTMKFLT